MNNPEVVISFTGDITNVQQGIKQIEALNARMASNLAGQFSNATKIISQDIMSTTAGKIPITNQLRRAFPELPAGMREYPTILQKVGTNFMDVNGKMMQYVETTASVQGKTVSLGGTLKDMGVAAKESSINIGELIKRGFFTIPVWTALRETVRGLTSAFKDSAKGIIEEDTALQNVKRGLQGTVESINNQLEDLKGGFEKLAVSTGVSLEKIISVFDIFKKRGFDVSTAMAITEATTKFAVATFSDATEVSKSLSGAFVKLVDTTGKSGSEIDQYNALLAQMNTLSKTNKISMDDFGTSLGSIADFAKLNNLSLHDTVALLATLDNAGMRGAAAGTQLRTAIEKILTNLDKLTPILGVKVNPALDSTASIILKVTGAMNDMTKSGRNTSEVSAALDKIFGARSSEVISSLAKLHDNLVQNMQTSGSLKELSKDYDDVSKTLGKQVDRYHQLNAEIGKSFLTGFTGAKGFNESMITVNNMLQELQKNAEKFGILIRQAFSGGTATAKFDALTELSDVQSKLKKQIIDAETGKLNLPDLLKTRDLLKDSLSGKFHLSLDPGTLARAYTSVQEQIIKVHENLKQADHQQALLLADAAVHGKIEEKVNAPLITRVDLLKLESQLKKQLQAEGLSELDVEAKILEFRQTTNGYVQQDLELQSRLVKQAAILEEIELRRSRAKGLVENQLEGLRLQGATERQLTEARIEMERQYGINQSRNDLLKNELDLEREITKEKMNQTKLSSDSMKLFELSKKYGSYTAREAQDFISGKLTLNQMGSNLEKALKEFFPQNLEEAQAKKFFFGTGEGQGIGIPETTSLAQKGFNPIPAESIKLPDIKTNIGNIKIELKKIFSEKDTTAAIINSLKEAITSNPDIIAGIEGIVDEF